MRSCNTLVNVIGQKQNCGKAAMVGAKKRAVTGPAPAPALGQTELTRRLCQASVTSIGACDSETHRTLTPGGVAAAPTRATARRRVRRPMALIRDSLRGKRAYELLKSRRSPSPVNTHNSRGVNSALSVSWIGIGYLGKKIWIDGGEKGRNMDEGHGVLEGGMSPIYRMGIINRFP
ncbi:hypothetical protein EVAR_53319_1 [Eumeta japonica]|uniref:Uncharacterized protein n=1 Tax=Eumeta variegata TaxID=151549 RepID=A0A4C1XA70_EUMVA|nr:hypothetical protein EVAR_53319_1 [Eumeta japonica]